MVTFKNLTIIYTCIYIKIASSFVPSTPSSHERVGHNRSLGYMK
jgi:hypothetical protein